MNHYFHSSKKAPLLALKVRVKLLGYPRIKRTTPLQEGRCLISVVIAAAN
jgi:hypothetical protein